MKDPKFSQKTTMKWNDEKRVYLCCLFRFFHPEIDLFCAVFSEIFRDHLTERGIDADISRSTLSSQWNIMRQPGSPAHDLWDYVHVSTEFSHDGQWGSTIRKIKTTATRLGIVLREKQYDDLDSKDLETSTGNFTRPQTTPQDRGNPNAFIDKVDDDEDSKDPGDGIPQHDSHLVTCHGKICFWCFLEANSANLQQENYEELNTRTPDSPMNTDTSTAEDDPATSDSDSFSFMLDFEHEPELLPAPDGDGHPGICRSKDLPPILFRWYNEESAGINDSDLLRAGLFADNESPDLDPSDLSRDEWLEFFTHHVTREKIPSPFISTCLLPITPIYRALKYEKNAKITIIDTSRLDTVVVKARELVPLTATRTPGWHGLGEYLIWKEVPEAAIICTFTLSRLEQIAKEWTDIGDLLQLDRIRKHRRSGKVLYLKIAENTRSQRKPRVTFGRLMHELDVPLALQALVTDKFEEAWTMDRRWRRSGEPEDGENARARNFRDLGPMGAYDHGEDRSYVVAETESAFQDDDQLHGRCSHPRLRAEFRGVLPPDYEYRPPNLPEVESSTSEESEQDPGSEPIVNCPRDDTSSEGCFSLRDDDDDDDSEHRRWREETASLRDVQLFTPSAEQSPSQRSHLLPIDLNRRVPHRRASRQSSQTENAAGNDVIEVD